MVSDSDAGWLDSLSLAERARAHGTNPSGLFRWLLTHQRFDFITEADEDAAAQHMREFNQGPRICENRGTCGGGGRSPGPPRPAVTKLTDDERFVQACLLTAKQHRVADPFYIALEAKGWSRGEWDQKCQDFELRQVQRWMPVAEAS